MFNQVGTEKLFQGWTAAVEFHKYPSMPFGNLKGNEPVGPTVEVAHTSKFRCVNERAGQIISPTVVWTTENFGFAFGLCHHGRGVMAANVKEAAQDVITASDNEDWFAGNLAGNIATRLANLVGALNDLPRAGEDGALF